MMYKLASTVIITVLAFCCNYWDGLCCLVCIIYLSLFVWITSLVYFTHGISLHSDSSIVEKIIQNSVIVHEQIEDKIREGILHTVEVRF